ncbi:MAG: sugar ABC transporter permease, partial [Angelakisella sp.]
STVPMIILALIIAFLLNTKKLTGTHVYRSLFFLPNVTSIVAVAIVFSTLFGNKYGLINFLLTSCGLEAQPWLKQPALLQVAISSMGVWRWTGYNAIIFLAGLQKIDYSLYESARIDGASTFKVFWKIALPLLNPVIMFVVITSTIGGLQIFTEPQVLVGNNGGAGGGGMTIVLYLYRQAFIRTSFGYAAAVSWMLFFIIGIFSLLNWFLVNKANKE